MRMRKSIWITVAFFCLIGATAYFLPFNEIHLLDEVEQQRIKQGKQFWEWTSPYGQLAMHYIEKGQGDNHVLLLHGYRAHSYTWREVIEPLAQAGYHVWAPDLIGYGLSDKPDHAPYDYHFFVQQIQDFAVAKQITKPHVIGNSMGGGLALSLALANPDQVTSLVLISALGYPLELPYYFALSTYFIRFWKAILGPTLIRNRMREIVYCKDAITEEQVEAYSLPYRFPGGVEASVATLQKFDNDRLLEISKEYTSLSHPVLIIWGDNDTLIPLTHYEQFINDFPYSDRCLITDCGHIPQEEKGPEVLAAMLPFLDKASAAER